MGPLSRIVIRNSPILWLSGVLLPVLYVFYFKNIKKPLVILQKFDRVQWSLLLFLLVQLISTSLSVGRDYFTTERFVAIIHNLVAYSFIPLGYSLGYFSEYKTIFIRSLERLFKFITIASILAFCYSVITSNYLSYPGVLSFGFQGENKFTSVIFNQQGWIFDTEFPRSRVMGVFPNSTAILVLIIYTSLFFYSNFGWIRKVMYGLLFVGATLTTGSRNGILIALLLFFIQFISNKRVLVATLFLIPILAIASLILIEFLTDLRKDSNETRIQLYKDSITYAFDQNPFFGLGMKPKITSVAAGELPIGSHSTLLGYFIKNGLIGGTIALYFFLYLIFKSSMRILLLFRVTSLYSVQRLVLCLGVIGTLLSLLFDDIDAYELIPFYFGFLLYSFEKA